MSATPEPVDPTPSPEQPHRSHRWLIVLGVIAGLVVAGAIGYALGGNSRDDDVSKAAEQARQQDQANDQKAIDAIKTGFANLGDAIAQEEAQDDQQAQAAVDDATKQIQDGFKQLGSNFSNALDQTVSDLKTKVNDAIKKADAEQQTQQSQAQPAAGE
jgi:hypothetical protein